MKYPKTPTCVAPAAHMTISQKFSWASGHWYLRRRSTTRITSVVVIVEVGSSGWEEGGQRPVGHPLSGL